LLPNFHFPRNFPIPLERTLLPLGPLRCRPCAGTSLTPLPHSATTRSSGNCRPSSRRLLREHHHPGCHLRTPSALGFTTTSSARAPCASMSSLAPPSTSGPCYCRRRAPTGPCHRGESFPMNFRFPQPFLGCSSLPPPTSPRRRQLEPGTTLFRCVPR
jgi:hypothetical protein